MGTKNKPSKFDCYSSAHPDEPMFVLLARDRTAAALVRSWADAREAEGRTDPSKIAEIAEARACADQMEAWRHAFTMATELAQARQAIEASRAEAASIAAELEKLRASAQAVLEEHSRDGVVSDDAIGQLGAATAGLAP